MRTEIHISCFARNLRTKKLPLSERKILIEFLQVQSVSAHPTHALINTHFVYAPQPSQVISFLPVAKSQTRNRRIKTYPRAVVFTASGEFFSRFRMFLNMGRCPGKQKTPPTSHQVSATPLKVLIRQIQPTSMPHAPKGLV
jgi:hypothetical protein